MSEILIDINKEEHIATVTLNYQPLNIVKADVYKRITQVFTELNSVEGISVVILNSACKYFSAGAELEFVQDCDNQEKLDAITKTVCDCMMSIYNCKYPVIASVHGRSIGAGTGMAASSDIIIASDDATFSLPEATAGFFGSAEFLEMIIPRRLARYYFYTGESLTAQEMKHLGAVFDVMPRDMLMSRTMEIAKRIAAQSPLALAYAKAAMNHNDDERLTEKFCYGAQYNIPYNTTSDFKETIMAFKDRRKPVFIGK